jgi:nucleoside 2-deoxyribosyltransferase
VLHIIGGTYVEKCREPYWSELFGSGGRAAAALSALSNEVKLDTYIGEQDIELLHSMAATFNYQTHIIPVTETTAFEYVHGLSKPHVYPWPMDLDKTHSHKVEGDNILRFGFLEGDAVVLGNRVVYDPQAPNPRPFRENGSRAEQLAIVANYQEIAALSGHEDFSKIGAVLLEDHGAEVIVVKRGALGATIITRSEIVTTPAFRTPQVWPIGSGDVFTAVFAYYWAELHDDPVAAAAKASLATAYYCNSRSLPIPKVFPSGVVFDPVVLRLNDQQQFPHPPEVYLAGPFFNMAQRWLVEESRAALLDQELQVFSPLHDVGYGSASDVVPADIAALERSKAIFAIVDDLDAGTLFEVGYARAKNIPVIAFTQEINSEGLKMLEGTACSIVSDFASAIYLAAWSAMAL